MNLNAVFDKYIWTKYPVPNTVLGPRDLTFLREENDYIQITEGRLSVAWEKTLMIVKDF